MEQERYNRAAALLDAPGTIAEFSKLREMNAPVDLVADAYLVYLTRERKGGDDAAARMALVDGIDDGQSLCDMCGGYGGWYIAGFVKWQRCEDCKGKGWTTE